jgi:hypothetical protein
VSHEPDDCPAPGTFTLCNGNTENNLWIEDGVCVLDNLYPDQIIYILERDERARLDLKRVTTCAELLCLADTTPRLPTTEEEDQVQSRMNNNPNSLPYYTLFRGNYQDM